MSRNFVLIIVATSAFFCTPTCYAAVGHRVHPRVDPRLAWDAFLKTWVGQRISVPEALKPALKIPKIEITYKFLSYLFPDGLTQQKQKVDAKTSIMEGGVSHEQINFFPSGWSRGRVMSKIVEVFRRPTQYDVIEEGVGEESTLYLVISGITVERIPIIIIINQCDELVAAFQI